jgi:hypothetical protein
MVFIVDHIDETSSNDQAASLFNSLQRPFWSSAAVPDCGPTARRLQHHLAATELYPPDSTRTSPSTTSVRARHFAGPHSRYAITCIVRYLAARLSTSFERQPKARTNPSTTSSERPHFHCRLTSPYLRHTITSTVSTIAPQQPWAKTSWPSWMPSSNNQVMISGGGSSTAVPTSKTSSGRGSKTN